MKKNIYLGEPLVGSHIPHAGGPDNMRGVKASREKGLEQATTNFLSRCDWSL